MRRLILSVALALAATATASATTADELVQKNTEARGGEAALRAIQSITLHGRMNFSGGDFSVDSGSST